MTRIRNALSAVEDLGQRLEGNAVKVWVEPRGGLIFHLEPDELFVPLRKGFAQGLAHIGGIDLVAAWNGPSGLSGPNLVRARPSLRIIPGKLSGEPHVSDTRIMTTALSALRGRGLSIRDIRELYPRLSEASVEEAVDLEAQLDRNLRPAA